MFFNIAAVDPEAPLSVTLRDVVPYDRTSDSVTQLYFISLLGTFWSDMFDEEMPFCSSNCLREFPF